ncbi:YggT family protein [Candidatus Curculioniphilus buchneri]|uniref:YggT family protein n=1 Tax=Candidatus Curculioniphilus buchneri TaxID=690594 RepID=UPI00376EF2AF
MLTLAFLVKMLIDFYISILLLRIWMKWSRCDFYNPFARLIVKVTQTMIEPFLRRIIPNCESLDSVSLLLVLTLAMIKFPLLTLIEMKSLLFEPMYFLIGLLALLKAAGKLVFWVLIVRSLLSWTSPGRSPMDVIFYQLSEPLIQKIRCILPTVGGIDFSVMLIILIIYALNYFGMNLFPTIWNRL